MVAAGYVAAFGLPVQANTFDSCPGAVVMPQGWQMGQMWNGFVGDIAYTTRSASGQDQTGNALPQRSWLFVD